MSKQKNTNSMKTLIIYFDSTLKNFQKVTPFAQGPEYPAKERFNGDFADLADVLTHGNYYKLKIVG